MRTNRRWTQGLIHMAVVIGLLTGRASLARAGIDQWTSNGPTQAGGIITALVIDPQTPSTLYAATQDDGVFKSTDGGASWNAANNGLPTNSFVQTLAIDPQTPATLYVGSYDGRDVSLFRSTNGGSSWDSLVTFTFASLGIHALAIDPQTPTTIYVATWNSPLPQNKCAGSFVKSTDGGLTWGQSSLGVCLASLAIDPQTPATLYAGSRGYLDANTDLWKSTDGGATFFTNTNGIPSGPQVGPSGIQQGAGTIADLVIDPVTPMTVYAATGAGVYKTTDGGANWNAMNTGLPVPAVTALAIDPLTPTILYAGVDGCNGVFKSINGGGSWTELNSGLTNRCVTKLAINLQTPNIYAGTNDGEVFAIEQSTFIVAAVAPVSRSVQVGHVATAYALILNYGTASAMGCSLSPATNLPAIFSFQALNCATNLPLAALNTPVNISPGGAGCFIFALTPSSSIAPTDVTFNFDCTNTDPAPVTPGVNTFLFSASPTPPLDFIASIATDSNDGVLTLPGPKGEKLVVASSINVASVGGTATVDLNTGGVPLPLTLRICLQWDFARATCRKPRPWGASATLTVTGGEINSYMILVRSSGTIPFNPGKNRIYLNFHEGATVKGAVRGRTSVAVRTK